MRCSFVSFFLLVAVPALTDGCPYFQQGRQLREAGDERSLQDVITTGNAWTVGPVTGNQTAGIAGTCTPDLYSETATFCYGKMFEGTEPFVTTSQMDYVRTAVPGVGEADGSATFMHEDLDRRGRAGRNGPRGEEILSKGARDTGGFPTALQVNGENTGAAGYTYLGQLLSHDLNFDGTSVMGRPVEPDTLQNFETPHIDLSTMYGGGITKESYLGEDGKFQFGGCTVEGNPCDYVRDENDNAHIPDFRNDNTQIIGSCQRVFQQLHNQLVDNNLAKGMSVKKAAAAAKAETIKTWQSVIMHDLLPHFINADTYARIMNDDLKFYKPGTASYDQQRIPAEFSTCAYRTFHSRLASGYGHNAVPPATIRAAGLFSQDRERVTFEGGRALPEGMCNFGIESFFEVNEDIRLNKGHMLDPLNSDSIMNMPVGTPGNAAAVPEVECSAGDGECRDDVNGGRGIIMNQVSNENGDFFSSLAWHDLARGQTVNMPGGISLATMASQVDDSIEVHTMDEFRATAYGVPFAFETATDMPCLLYIVYEALLEQAGNTLGNLGSSIVGESIKAFVKFTPDNILDDPEWTSEITCSREVTMIDVICSLNTPCFNAAAVCSEEQRQTCEQPTKKPAKPFYPPVKKYYGKDEDCAEMFCDVKFAQANYYRKYGSFTRYDCMWDPSPYYGKDTCPYLNTYEKKACKCFWDYEAQCQTAVKKNPTEFELAAKVDAYATKYGYGGAFDTCFDEEIYQCLCNEYLELHGDWGW